MSGAIRAGIGHKVAQLALEKGYEVYSLYKQHPTNFGRPIKLDLTNQNEISKVIIKLKPEAITHSAAYTDVDGCETNQNLAWKINAEPTKHIAIASANINSHLTDVSTDYVFDGEKGLYTEEDKTNQQITKPAANKTRTTRN
jgi:dTDP-4-dehydrorhamnose reductase